MSQTVSLSFFRFEGALKRLWAMSMMGAARRPLAKTPNIGFWKLCGSGVGEGFTPTSNPSVIAIVATWPDAETAVQRVRSAPIFQRYRNRAEEDWSVFLQATSSRGQWSGVEPFEPKDHTIEGPLAALTRASIKPRILSRFWGRVPSISDVIGKDTNVAFKIGIGEIPMLHQVTFSIWPSIQSMNDFARTGPHAEAIRAVRAEGWFSEELYARFVIHSDLGSWGGVSPLNDLEVA